MIRMFNVKKLDQQTRALLEARGVTIREKFQLQLSPLGNAQASMVPYYLGDLPLSVASEEWIHTGRSHDQAWRLTFEDGTRFLLRFDEIVPYTWECMNEREKSAALAERIGRWGPGIICDGEHGEQPNSSDGWFCMTCGYEGSWGSDTEHAVVPPNLLADMQAAWTVIEWTKHLPGGLRYRFDVILEYLSLEAYKDYIPGKRPRIRLDFLSVLSPDIIVNTAWQVLESMQTVDLDQYSEDSSENP
jgi:hypothetical protein